MPLRGREEKEGGSAAAAAAAALHAWAKLLLLSWPWNMDDGGGGGDVYVSVHSMPFSHDPARRMTDSLLASELAREGEGGGEEERRELACLLACK